MSFVVTFFKFVGEDSCKNEVTEFKKMLGRRLDFLEEDIKVIRNRLREDEPEE
jgi:transposase